MDFWILILIIIVIFYFISSSTEQKENKDENNTKKEDRTKEETNKNEHEIKKITTIDLYEEIYLYGKSTDSKSKENKKSTESKVFKSSNGELYKLCWYFDVFLHVDNFAKASNKIDGLNDMCKLGASLYSESVKSLLKVENILYRNQDERIVGLTDEKDIKETVKIIATNEYTYTDKNKLERKYFDKDLKQLDEANIKYYNDTTEIK